MLDPAAIENLKSNQRQLDMDGCEVGVSRQALEELIAAYESLSTVTPAEVGGLVERLNIKAGVMEMGERIAWGSDTAIMREAATALEVQAARMAELEAAIRGLLDCPDIADNDHKDEETHAAERAARSLLNGGAQGMSEKQMFGEPEQVEVRLDDDGQPAFFFSSRDGWENLGPEIRMAADSYAIGTKITLEEPLP